jgi:hypothetical protein
MPPMHAPGANLVETAAVDLVVGTERHHEVVAALTADER